MLKKQKKGPHFNEKQKAIVKLVITCLVFAKDKRGPTGQVAVYWKAAEQTKSISRNPFLRSLVRERSLHQSILKNLKYDEIQQVTIEWLNFTLETDVQINRFLQCQMFEFKICTNFVVHILS